MNVGLLLAISLAVLVGPRLFESREPITRTSWPPETTPLLRLFWWIDFVYATLVHRLVILNDPPLPETGPAILIANHTSGIDHMILQASCRRVLGFMIAREFSDIPVGGWFCRKLGCIPVNRDGHDLAAARAGLRALEAGRILPIFPEGRIVRTAGREFAEGKSGAAFLAIRSGAPVIPAYIRGTPIRPGVWMAWYAPSRVRVMFGPPVDLSDLLARSSVDHARDRETLRLVTERLMDSIKALQCPSLAAEDDL